VLKREFERVERWIVFWRPDPPTVNLPRAKNAKKGAKNITSEALNKACLAAGRAARPACVSLEMSLRTRRATTPP